MCVCINERYRLSEFTTKIKTGRQMAVFYSICISLNQLLLSELLLWKSVVLICSLQTRDTQAALLWMFFWLTHMQYLSICKKNETKVKLHKNIWHILAKFNRNTLPKESQVWGLNFPLFDLLWRKTSVESPSSREWRTKFLLRELVKSQIKWSREGKERERCLCIHSYQSGSLLLKE